MTAFEWLETACWGLVAVGFFGNLAWDVIRSFSRRPLSAAEQARAEGFGSSAHPAGKAITAPGLPADGRPLDDYEQRALDEVRKNFTWAPEPHQPRGQK